MLNTYTNTSLAVATDAPITFNNNAIHTCGPVSHAAGTPSIVLSGTGHYLVAFNGSAAITDTTAGNISVQLYVNGEAYPGAQGTIYSATADQDGNINFITLVRVLPNCCAIRDNSPLTLTVVNTGLAATFTNAALTVMRVSK